MKKVSYKQKYEELLIKQHERKYIHIAISWKEIGRFFVFLGSLSLAIANIFLIIFTWRLLELKDLFEQSKIDFYQLLILYPLIGEYVLIGAVVISLIALIKGGYNKIKSIDQDGLINGLIVGLIGSLIVGLIGGLIGSLIVGLIVGLIGGLIGGLIYGLTDEFE